MDGGKLPCILVENKCDLLGEGEEDNIESLKEFADKNGYVGCYRASAKTGKNINESMEFLIKSIVERMEGISSGEGKEVFTTDRKSVVLEKQNHTSSKSKNNQKDNCC